jgi:phenylacetyl-CoA:acceptor oxidoreductase
MQYAWGGNVGMQLIKEVADNVAGHRGVIMNTGAAQKLGIAEGDAIEIATPQRSVRGRAVLRQGIRPDTLLLIGQFDHWATPLAKDFGVPSLNSLATMSLEQTDATGSGADIVRVKIQRAAGGTRGRGAGTRPMAASDKGSTS